ncbi:hypothetical protein C8J56DRAFT_889758 [Mycena floridula]|nr:hypothetical protein C8J56DRAFT_889758 [Mycena floridula]
MAAPITQVDIVQSRSIQDTSRTRPSDSAIGHLAPRARDKADHAALKKFLLSLEERNQLAVEELLLSARGGPSPTIDVGIFIPWDLFDAMERSPHANHQVFLAAMAAQGWTRTDIIRPGARPVRGWRHTSGLTISDAQFYRDGIHLIKVLKKQRGK